MNSDPVLLRIPRGPYAYIMYTGGVKPSFYNKNTMIQLIGQNHMSKFNRVMNQLAHKKTRGKNPLNRTNITLGNIERVRINYSNQNKNIAARRIQTAFQKRGPVPVNNAMMNLVIQSIYNEMKNKRHNLSNIRPQIVQSLMGTTRMPRSYINSAFQKAQNKFYRNNMT